MHETHHEEDHDHVDEDQPMIQTEWHSGSHPVPKEKHGGHGGHGDHHEMSKDEIKQWEIQISYLLGLIHVFIGMGLMIFGLAWLLSNLFQIVVYPTVKSIWTLDFLSNICALAMSGFCTGSGGFVRKVRLRLIFTCIYLVGLILFILLQVPRMIVSLVGLLTFPQGTFLVSDNAPTVLSFTIYLLVFGVAVVLAGFGFVHLGFIRAEIIHRKLKLAALYQPWKDDI
jgi:hypothetical protein